jgi:hypothetical protein
MSKRTLPAGAAAAVLALSAVAVPLAPPAQAEVTSTTITSAPGDTVVYAKRAFRKAPAEVRAAASFGQVTFSFDTSSKKVFIKVRTPIPAAVPTGYKLTTLVAVQQGTAPAPEPGRAVATRRAASGSLVGNVVASASGVKLTQKSCPGGKPGAVRLTSYSSADDSFVVSAPISCLEGVRKVSGYAVGKTFNGRTTMTVDQAPQRRLAR